MQQLGTSQSVKPSVPADSQKVIEDVFRYLGIVLRGWRFILLGLAVALTAAALHISQLQTVYKAAARLLVIQQGGRPVSVSAGGDPFQISQGANDALAPVDVA